MPETTTEHAYTFKMPTPIMDRLRDRARQDQRSIAAIIRIAIIQYLDQEEK